MQTIAFEGKNGTIALLVGMGIEIEVPIEVKKIIAQTYGKMFEEDKKNQEYKIPDSYINGDKGGINSGEFELSSTYFVVPKFRSSSTYKLGKEQNEDSIINYFSSTFALEKMVYQFDSTNIPKFSNANENVDPSQMGINDWIAVGDYNDSLKQKQENNAEK